MRALGKRISMLGLITLLFSTALLSLSVPTVAAPGKGEPPKAQAETVHLFLKANGQKLESDLSSDGSMEVLYYEQSVVTAREAGSGMATGRRQYQPLMIRKRIDKASPLLMKALTENQTVDATFVFSRPDSRTGRMQAYYRVTLQNARVNSYKHVLDPDDDGDGVEEISFVFHTIQWTYTNGGVTHEDTWDQQR